MRLALREGISIEKFIIKAAAGREQALVGLMEADGHAVICEIRHRRPHLAYRE